MLQVVLGIGGRARHGWRFAHAPWMGLAPLAVERPTRPRVWRGASPRTVSFPFERLANPMHVKVTTRVLLGGKRHGCHGARAPRWERSGWQQTWRPERQEMTAAPKWAIALKSLSELLWLSRPAAHAGKVVVVREATGTCTSRATGVEVQASRERHAEITSGRARTQQGPTATCKDPPAEAKAEGGGRVLVWRMSPYERRRRGNALRGGAGRHPATGNTEGQAKGLSAAGGLRIADVLRTLSRAWAVFRRVGEPGCKPSADGVYARRRLSHTAEWEGTRRKAGVANRTREIRPSGMTTGAPGNVTMEAGLRSTPRGFCRRRSSTGR